MASTIKYAKVPMGYAPDAGRFSNNSFTSRPQSRFPAHAQSMDSAPTGSRPIIVYEPDGKGRWALYHQSVWRPLDSFKDAGGVTRWRISGDTFINNPCAWASS